MQLGAVILILVGGALLGPAYGQADRDRAASPSTTARSETSDQPAAQPSSDSIRASLGPSGDPLALRGTLEAHGVTSSLTYVGEALANAAGGLKRGAIYEGRLDAQFDVDLDAAVGWSGAALHANVYQIHGRGLSRYFIGNLFVASGIEALSSTRLYEAWIEQELADGVVAIRAGQLAADTEFVVSQYAALFVNSTFGFPAILATDLPNGGPAYPLATPGIRVKLAPHPGLSMLLGVFDGAPAGQGPGDPQANDRGGIEFRARDPALVMGEVGYAYGGKDDAGTLKLGGWTHLGRFADQRFAEPPGSLLADPAGSGIPRRLRGNAGGYVVLDQLLYRAPGTEDGGLALFVRAAGAPGDRNPVDLYVDGGLTYKGLVPGRPDDTAGISFAYARISAAARAFDADAAAFDPGAYRPVRSSEVMVEATYQAQIVPGFTVQPDIQYIRRPGGGILNPRSPSGAVERSAVVVGARTTIRY